MLVAIQVVSEDLVWNWLDYRRRDTTEHWLAYPYLVCYYDWSRVEK